VPAGWTATTTGDCIALLAMTVWLIVANTPEVKTKVAGQINLLYNDGLQDYTSRFRVQKPVIFHSTCDRERDIQLIQFKSASKIVLQT